MAFELQFYGSISGYEIKFFSERPVTDEVWRRGRDWSPGLQVSGLSGGTRSPLAGGFSASNPDRMVAQFPPGPLGASWSRYLFEGPLRRCTTTILELGHRIGRWSGPEIQEMVLGSPTNVRQGEEEGGEEDPNPTV